MAQAVTRLFPGVRLAIGPAIEDGFYYDFDRPEPFTPEDLARIEAVMREIVRADHPFERQELGRAEAIAFFRERGERYKVEILEGLDAPRVSFYRQGDFVDLCRGPHVRSTGELRAFKLLSSSGAYWRGNEKNPMLQRIYGTAWLTQAELDKHLWRLEEAKKRDHRKLGRELDLFDFYDVSPGAPFWLPNGMILVRELEKFAREHLDARGYDEISTPLLVNKRLWEQSGHWEHYQGNMFTVEVEDEIYSLKPMNCPESTFVYRRALRSYRDLPMRLSEMGRCHRNERSGTLTGLVRVRQFTQDDAHIYCRPDQLQDEITQLLDLVSVWYKTFELQPSYMLATRPEKRLGTEAQWDAAEAALHDALKANGLAYELNPGDGTFYGPKIDIYVQDVLGRAWQIATIQVDLTMVPERFQLEYIDSDGQPKRPVELTTEIDLRTPGIEKLRLTPKDVNNGEAPTASCRDFALLDVDEAHLNRLGLRWETIVEVNRRWLLLHDYPLPAGYAVAHTKIALEIPPNYPGAQIYGFYAYPPLALSSGRTIESTQLRGVLLGVEFHGWSRNRGAGAPWNPTTDNVMTQLALVDAALAKEVGE